MAVAKIISIGDELLIGQVTNTNSTFIAEKLNFISIPVTRVVAIGDNEKDIIEELNDSVKNFDVTVITGGLGPTHDDITKNILVRFFKDELVLNENILENVKGIFKQRGVEMPEVNKEQALVPKSSMIIWNPNGTAPGMYFEKEGKLIISLPGVPFEMKAMIENSVIPMLREKLSGKIEHFIKTKTLLTFGAGETILSELLGDVKEIIKGSRLAFLPSAVGVRLRIDTKGVTEEEAFEKLKKIETYIREKIGKYIFGINDETLEKIVSELLIKSGIKIAAAESCTGGILVFKTYFNSGFIRIFSRGSGIVCERSERRNSECQRKYIAGIRCSERTDCG
jgi:molybdenum cofactor synthesis domain